MVNERARALRASVTDAERKLWSRLKHLKHHGFHFRRQAPIGDYIVDFVCHSAKIVVEVDGSQHASEEGLIRDALRTAFLETRGYRVLRYWNGDAWRHTDSIADAIPGMMQSGEITKSLTGAA